MEIELLTVPDVARALKVSPRQVYVLLDEGRLASVRLGRLRRVSAGSLDKFIAGLPRAKRPNK